MRKAMLVAAGVSMIALPAHAAAAAEAAAEDEAAPAVVVTATPLGGAAAVIASARDLDASRAASIVEQLVRTGPGITVNEIQGNPLQPDINYRGFTASPLLGTPQGLSVYLDGVRLNQPFGDVVSWDLVPHGAIASVDMVAGAAPQFGRNSLGGALVLRSKTGRTDPGIRMQASAGSFGRVTGMAQGGGTLGNGFDGFVLADHFRESGWRDFSRSRATRGFARLGWTGADSLLALSGMVADTDLNGNGLQEMRLLDADRSSIYTAPDNTQNRAGMIALHGEHDASGTIKLRGNAFWRHIRTATYNGDVNEGSLGENPYQPTDDEQAALFAAGYSGVPLAGETQANTPFPRWRCIANVLLAEEPNETCNGLVNRSRSDQDEFGGTIEAVLTAPLGSMANTLTVGAGFVRNTSHFLQTTQFGYLLADRTVMPVDGLGAFADGTQDSEDAFDARVDLRSVTSSLGIYALDSLELTAALRLELAGRYDRTRVRNRDAITPGGGTGSLDSNPLYERFNPAAALHWQAAAGLALSASWSQASRAPSAIELGCSDPASPCRLPNALAGDPPLRQVVARTAQLRAALSRRAWSASASLFRTDSHDDILFVAADSTGYGYFRNFGKTRRQGFEIEGEMRAGPIALRASYTLLDATYRSGELVNGAASSDNDGPAPGFEGAIAIAPGDRIPLVPRHAFKAAVRWTAAPWLAFDADMTAISGVVARGNENNRHQPDGIWYLGKGETDGYAVFNAGVEVRPVPALTLFATVRNLFDRNYATAAQLGATAFDSAGRYVARPFAGPVIDGERPLVSSTFHAPGAPRSVEAGLRLAF